MSESSPYKKRRDTELHAFAVNESGDGKNTNHGQAKYGPLAGQTAVGKYAFMPGTLKEIERTSQDPRLAAFKKMSQDELAKELVKNPELERAFAENYYDEIYAKHPDDVEARAASWLMGPNRSDKAMHELMERLPKVQQYVDNFKKHGGLEENRMPAAAPSEEKFMKTMQQMPPLSMAEPEEEKHEDMPMPEAYYPPVEEDEDLLGLPVAELNPMQQDEDEEDEDEQA